jgi:hypothetical protein
MPKYNLPKEKKNKSLYNKSNSFKLLKLTIKSGKDGTQSPRLFGHIGYKISKNRKNKKKVHWASKGPETQFSSKFGTKLSLLCPF